MPELPSPAEPVEREHIGAVLDHLARYRMSIFPAMERLPGFQDHGPRTIKTLLRECQNRSLIGAAPLHQGARYWHLEPAGARQCGLDEQRSGPLSEQAKIRALAILRFCCLSDRLRHRLSADELVRAFPGVASTGLRSGYYFDPQGSGRLGLVRVDLCQSGRWDRVLQTISEDVASHLGRPDFKRLAQAGRLEITVLTVFRQKARRIVESLAQNRNAAAVPVQVIAIPELLPLVTSIH